MLHSEHFRFRFPFDLQKFIFLHAGIVASQMVVLVAQSFIAYIINKLGLTLTNVRTEVRIKNTN